jgi:hypothetical protein
MGEATKILGYESTVLLGYRDSGMQGTEPGGFASVDLDVGEHIATARRALLAHRSQVADGDGYERDLFANLDGVIIR